MNSFQYVVELLIKSDCLCEKGIRRNAPVDSRSFGHAKLQLLSSFCNVKPESPEYCSGAHCYKPSRWCFEEIFQEMVLTTEASFQNKQKCKCE